MPALKQRHQNGGRSPRSGNRGSSLPGSQDLRGKTLQSHSTKAHVHHSSRSIFSSWTYLLGFLVVLVSVAHWGNTRLPTPLNEPFDPKTGITQYSEANVRKITKTLSEDIGLRLVGTIQMVDAEEYLIREIKSMQEQALIATAKGAKDLPKFEYWTQVNDGSHRFDFMSKVVMKMYTNMTNVVVRLSCGPECDKNSVLLNGHVDTTLGSPGATDDALGVATLMETIRVLSLRPALKRNSLVFLLNGGEESLQDASHSFITTHELKDNIRAVINIEGAGTKGPEILFQANSREMVDAYKRVPYPHGSVMANDLFATGIILSDTDFRQFVEYGDLTGLDMAVYKNSYAYHTHLDTNEHMEVGLPQHLGENTLAMVTYLGNHADLSGPKFEKSTDVIFFDTLGLFFTVYSFQTAIYLAMGVGVFALFAISLGASRPTVKSTASVFASFAASMAGAIAVAKSLQLLGKPMQWFSGEWLPLIHFAPAALAAMVLVQYFVHDPKASHGANELSTLSGVHFFFAVFMGTATQARIGSSYALCLYSLSFTVSMFYNRTKISGLSKKNQREDMSASAIGVDYKTYFVATAIPTLTFAQLAFCLLDTLVPLMGRIGTNAPVDVICAGMVGFFCFMISPPLLAFVHRFGRGPMKKIIAALVILQLAILSFSVMFIRPFNSLHPQRVFAQHLRNMTSGETRVFVAHCDPGPFYDTYVAALESMYETKAKFHHGVDSPGDWHAVYPFSFFLDSYSLDTTPYIRARTENKTIAESNSPLTDLIKDSPKMVAENVRYDPGKGLRSLTILCTHADYIFTVVSFDAKLTAWSLDSDIPSKEYNHYVVRISSGYRADGWRMDLEYHASGPNDKLKVEITALEPEAFGGKAERELAGTGEMLVLHNLVKSKPEWMAMTYFSTIVDTFYL
ncbi:hypothetical protein EMPS_07960 [Entomortierella parvispora]|uniref:Peptide hydrolase n=1 Tax=Entomortierella parvispora TaxID=205924 RepID=A0A9P3HFY9_9FUNG|nr:hypothetical protein EMPS_07960 [Entomortierella parvispora]